jgi:trehalose 6-phosphate synthase/phosphatase
LLFHYRFLPYTVHFELALEEASDVCDENLSCVFEPVQKRPIEIPDDDFSNSSTVLKNSITDDKSNISIIQSLSHNNLSSSNLSIVESIDSEDSERQGELNKNNHHDNNDQHHHVHDYSDDFGSDLNSTSSNGSLLDSKLTPSVTKQQLQSNAYTIKVQSPSSQDHLHQHLIGTQGYTSIHSNINLQQSKIRSNSSSTTSSQNMSVQDFFFNNPNKTKMTLSSTSLEDVSTTPTLDEKLNSMYEKPQILPRTHSYNPASTTKFIKPKPLIRSITPQPLVNELSPKKSLLEPKLSSMRINRPQHSNLRNLKTSSMISLDKKIDNMNLNETNNNNNNNNSNNNNNNNNNNNININNKNNKPSQIHDTFNFDSVSSNFTDLLQNEEDEVLNRAEECSKVSPFGGFSRPHTFLDDKSTIFSTAPWKITEFDKSNGSLVKSVELARKNNVENFKWIGTVSMPSNIVPDNVKNDISKELLNNYNSNAIFLDDEVFQGHYYSFCKQILWPIFHYQIPDNPKSNAFENHSWNYYEKVNQIFAKKIAKDYKENDIVWIHDYHLMLLPQMLRKLIPNIRIGFFLHISFPSSEVFRCLAQRKNILEGMLGADCITFQNEEYMAHFLQSSNRLLLADFNEIGVYYKNRLTVVSYNPIGLDFNQLNNQLKQDIVKNWKDLINDRWSNKKLIVSRDKIDKIRGLKEKLLAYERFLDDHPSFVYETILILICVQSNKVDEDYRNELFSIIERINSKTNNISIDQPVVLLNQDVEFEQYLALLTKADVFIVSTLREGMNLTCHEFICATQELHSPLILSEFVGSASVLTDGPLISNPYNIKEVADHIYRCLTMPKNEKYDRWKKTFHYILENDSNIWVHKCLEDINNACKNSDFANSLNNLTPLIKDNYSKLFNINSKNSNAKKLFILNLDELTENLEIHGHKIRSLQQQLINKTLFNLSSDHNNHVYIFSLFQRSELLKVYGRIPDIGLIAENGGLIKPPRSNEWYKIVEETQKEWIPSAVDIIKSFCERLPGSYIEVEECNIMFNTGSTINIDKDYKNGLIGDLITHINELFGKDFNVHATLSKGVLFIKEMDLISKALAFVTEQCVDSENIVKLPLSGSAYASPVMQACNSSVENSPLNITPIQLSTSNGLNFLTDEINKPFEYFFTCGSITTVDEELYDFFNQIPGKKNLDPNNVITVQVGQSGSTRTCAKYSLNGINNLMTLLD